MQLTYRVLARINSILQHPKNKFNNYVTKINFPPNYLKDFVQNPQNNSFLHYAIYLSRLLEIHQGSIMQYFFNYYTSINNLTIPQEPMQEYLRVDSLALPFADNVAQNILNLIIARFVHTLPTSTDINFYIQTFNTLDTTPFVFFYHTYFDNIDVGNGKLQDIPTFSI